MSPTEITDLLREMARRKSHTTDWDEAQLARIGELVARGEAPSDRDVRWLEAFRSVVELLPPDQE